MRVVSLASGSSGNALLVEDGATRVLVDAGLPPRTLVSRLRQVGASPDTVSAVLLTHEHHDHSCGAVAFACQYQIPLVSEPRTLEETAKLPPAIRTGLTPARDALHLGHRKRLGTLEVRSFPVSHDAAAPCGYVITASSWAVCVAVDTGEVTGPMAEALRTSHLLVIEANHDEAMLHAGPYPQHLKRRIRSATGHLSNRQTALALEAALVGGPRWVWLAHLSKTNNRPALAVATVHQHLQALGIERVALQAMPPDLGPVWESPTTAVPIVEQGSLWTELGRPIADTRHEPPRVGAADPALSWKRGNGPAKIRTESGQG